MTERLVYIAQGEEAVSSEPDVVITTILGSCVSFCLWDPGARVGGMNHLLLPEVADFGGGIDPVGVVSMERLINGVLRLGGARGRLKAKIFGGSAMLSAATDIGARNVAFAHAFLAAERIDCIAESTGGILARRIRFRPASGEARQRFVKKAPEPTRPEPARLHEVEFFRD